LKKKKNTTKREETNKHGGESQKSDRGDQHAKVATKLTPLKRRKESLQQSMELTETKNKGATR